MTPLTLGTVQLGLPYGLHAASETPDRTVSRSILQAAVDSGISTFDTARDYGISEEVIGEFLADGPVVKESCIITKFRIPAESEASYESMRRHIRASLNTSLEALRQTRVHALLFHKAMHQDLKLLLSPLADIFQELREERLISHGGLSAYRPKDVEPIIGHPAFGCVQAPVNIFDDFLYREGWLREMAAAGMLIFARSIFLKGLLLEHPDRLSPGLADAAPYLHSLTQLARRAHMSVAELAFSYVRHMEGVGSIVFGADHAVQVFENVCLLDVAPLPEDLLDEMKVLFRGIPEHITAPGLWRN